VVGLGGIIGYILTNKVNLDMKNIHEEHIKRRNIRKQRLEAARSGASAEELKGLTESVT
jgi:hypothetical protein